MAARYTVIQYVPDPVADERVNIGVIAWDETGVHSKLLSNWRHVRSFGGRDVAFLREFAETLALETHAQGRLPFDPTGAIDGRQIEAMTEKWRHSIQFTAPRGSLKNAGALLAEVAPTFLREAHRHHRQGRSRRAAASIAAKMVVNAVNNELPGAASGLVKRGETVAGEFDKHRFDIVLKNGKPLAAVQALSFEIAEGEHIAREIDATAWTIDDVRRKNPAIPLAIFMLLPTGEANQQAFSRAQRVFKGLEADVVNENKMSGWAKNQARAIAARG